MICMHYFVDSLTAAAQHTRLVEQEIMAEDAFISACRRGDIDEVERLLNNNADVCYQVPPPMLTGCLGKSQLELR